MTQAPMWCLIHRWDSCQCSRCGKVRPVRYEMHSWDGCKCVKCGKARTMQHDWDGHSCQRCGENLTFNILYFSKGHVDIEYRGRILRLHGDIGINGFEAIDYAMDWLDHPAVTSRERLGLDLIPYQAATAQERQGIIDQIQDYFAHNPNHSNDRILFSTD